MATGVTAQEKHGSDALTAARPAHHDHHPLPEGGAPVTLSYAGKLAERDVLAPLPGSFLRMDGKGRTVVAKSIEPNSVVLSDNIFALHNLVQSGQRATLVYLDPPYGTGMEFHSRKLQHAYKDDRAPAAYLEFMRRRLILIREAMADDGSLYLHIGHQMLFHVKVILDEVFGPTNFRNLIVRRKCSSKNFTRNSYPNIHDYILFYTKSARFKWFQPTEAPEQDWLDREYPKEDAKGRYKLVPVHAPGTRNGETGNIWRNMSPPPGKHWQYTPAKLEQMDKRGEIHWSRTGNPRRKVYLTTDKTVALTDYWSKFRDAHHQSIPITGYAARSTLVKTAANTWSLVPQTAFGDTLLAAADASAGRTALGFATLTDYVTLAGAQTLTNKTITSPLGIVKGDVGLGNVDNTSDATKNAAAVTLTNKTMTSPAINNPTIGGTVAGAITFSSGSEWSGSGTTAQSGNMKVRLMRTTGQVNGVFFKGLAVADPMFYTPPGSDDLAIGFDTGAGAVNTTRFYQSGDVVIPNAAPSSVYSAGYRGIPFSEQSTDYTFVLADVGRGKYMNSGSSRTFTIPPNSSVAWPQGSAIVAYNYPASAATISVAPGSGVTLQRRCKAM